MSKTLPYKYQILSIFVAGLVLGGIILYVQLTLLGQDPDIPASEQHITSIINSSEEITIPDSMTDCNADDQCIVVDTTCSFCCKYVSINGKAEDAFNQRFDQSCARYDGGTCECFDLSTYPKCINRKCRLVEWGDAENDINRPIE